MRGLSQLPGLRHVAFDHCRVVLPWFVQTADTPAARLRRAALRLEHGDPKLAPGERTLVALVFFFSCLRQTFLAWRPNHRLARQADGIGPATQFRAAFLLAWRGNLAPSLYYTLRLYRHHGPAWAAGVIPHRELQILLRDTHRDVAPATLDLLDDKLAFHAFCHRHALPTAPVLTAFGPRGECRPEGAVGEEAWAGDLFTKPARSFSSRGVALWRYDATRNLYQTGEQTLERAGFVAWATREARSCTLLVQPRLRNAADIAALGGQALSNCRIVTARRTDGTLVVLSASFRMGIGPTATCDDPPISFCAAVQPDTGELTAAEGKYLTLDRVRHHPDTGALLAGARLPRWAEMRALALRAHASLPELGFIGWDLVDTDRGVLLLEGNLVWGANLAQRCGLPPLGVTEFAPLWLARRAASAR